MGLPSGIARRGLGRAASAPTAAFFTLTRLALPYRMHPAALLAVALSALALVPWAIAAEDVDIANLSKLRVKELKKLLDERGVVCEGCVEKEHILSKVEESLHLPVLSEEELAEAKAAKEGKDSSASKSSKRAPAGTPDTNRDEELQRILEKMNLGDKVKMFKADDFMKYAEDMQGFKDKADKEDL